MFNTKQRARSLDAEHTVTYSDKAIFSRPGEQEAGTPDREVCAPGTRPGRRGETAHAHAGDGRRQLRHRQ